MKTDQPKILPTKWSAISTIIIYLAIYPTITFKLHGRRHKVLGSSLQQNNINNDPSSINCVKYM